MLTMKFMPGDTVRPVKPIKLWKSACPPEDERDVCTDELSTCDIVLVIAMCEFKLTYVSGSPTEYVLFIMSPKGNFGWIRQEFVSKEFL
jgi:hypothetical protein